jgi:hypothetical protein
MSEIHQLPGSWPIEDLRHLLALADFDDVVADSEVLDLTLMALQDLEEQGAGELVLKAVFGDALSPGVRQNLVADLRDERPWEQFAQIDKQAGVFTAMVILQQAFPQRYATPDALCMRLRITAADRASDRQLHGIPPAAFLLRLLAAGMPADATLNRLFETELAGGRFADAPHLLWLTLRADVVAAREHCHSFDLYASWHWLEALKDFVSWEAEGWPDDSV